MYIFIFLASNACHISIAFCRGVFLFFPDVYIRFPFDKKIPYVIYILFTLHVSFYNTFSFTGAH